MKFVLAGKRFTSAIVLTLLIASAKMLQAQSEQVPDIIQPVQLNSDTTILYLNDFFINPAKIDSVTFSKDYSAHWNKSEDQVKIVAGSGTMYLNELKLWSEGKPVSIMLKRSQKKEYWFNFYPGNKTFKTVQLAGEMNDWAPARNNFEKDGNKWVARIELNPGAYQYQLVLDGKWHLDPGNKDSVDNNNGGFNSVFKTPENSAQSPALSTWQVSEGKFSFAIKNEMTDLFVYWQNTRLPVKYKYNDAEITVDIPKEAGKMARSFIRVYAQNADGMSNDLLIPLANGEVITDPAKLNRGDKQALSIYSVFMDRFFDGDSSNDKPVRFDSLKAKANYYGGDLAGVNQKIEAGYFDSLHVNTLWISPILQNPEGAYREYPEPHDWYSGYHGYWPISLTKIDYRFGNDAVFKKLVDDAHTYKMNVLVDLVANHVHEESPIYKLHPEWATQLNLPDGRKNIRLWDECRLTTWFDTFLPTLDFSNPEVIKLEVDSSLLWVTKFDIDGFRHDATKHIAIPFWRSLTLNLKKIEVKEKKLLYQIGETYGSKELVGSYIGSGMLDGQFDFNLFFDARAAFAHDTEGFEKLAATLQQSISFYGYHHVMGNITGNHDQPRFASLAGGALSFTEDARKAGWDRDVEVGSDIAYNKLAEMVAFIATIPGVPVIYYGDEIGMPGAGDPDNRRMMRFNNLSENENKLKQEVSKIMSLRGSHLSLTYGDFKLLQAKKTILVYERTYFNETALIVFNNALHTDTVYVNNAGQAVENFKPQFGNKCTYMESYPTGEEYLAVILPPKSFEIFIAKQ